jgi:hypothetical protein
MRTPRLRDIVSGGLAWLAIAGAAPTETRVDLELVLAVDVSDSVDADEALLQRRGYIEALTNRKVTDAIRAGPQGRIALTYIEWGDREYQRVVVGWRLIRDEASARAVADQIAEAGTQRSFATGIGAAITYAVPLFNDNGFSSSRHVIDISGDGPGNDGRPAILARNAAIAAGITINGLPILDHKAVPGWLNRYYANNVIGGPDAFQIVADDFDDFGRAVLSKLVLEIAGNDPTAGSWRRHHIAAMALPRAGHKSPASP